MKYVKYLVVILVSMFMFNTNVLAASSKFDPTINLEPEIVGNQITLILGYKGEEVMVVQHDLSWDSRYLTLVDVIPLEAFNVTKNNPIENGNYRTLSILGDSDYAFVDTNYAVVVFDLTDKFKVGTKTDLVWYNYESAGKEVFKYRHKGYIMTLERESRDKMVYLEKAIDNKTKYDYWLKHNWILLVLGVLVIIAIIVIILVWPTKRRKEQREQKVKAQIRDAEYNYGKNSYKIDNKKLDEIAGVNQEKDMSEAIIISDLNPFQSAEGSARTIAGQEGVITQEVVESLEAVQPAQPVNAGVTLVDSVAPVNNNSNNLVQVYIPDQVLAPGQAPVAAPVQQFVHVEETPVQEVPEVPTPQQNEFDIGFDPFNMKLNPEASAPVEEQPASIEMPQVVQQPVAPVQQPVGDDLIQDISNEPTNPNANDNLILFQPQTFESAHDSNIETLVIAFLFVLASLLFMPNSVKAFDYETDKLREYLVGNIPMDSSYDFNEDGNIDILDLIYTKDLNYVTMEEVGEDHPGFKDISLQGYTTTQRRGKGSTTTKKVTTTAPKTHPGFADRSTTTITTTGGYVSGTSGSNIVSSTVTSTRRTTTKANTTSRTTKKSSTTTKKGTTTTKKTATTTKTTTTTKTKMYKASFIPVNGTVGVKSVEFPKYAQVEVYSEPNPGYKYSSVTCTNNQSVTYNTDTKYIKISSLTADTSCTIRYVAIKYKIDLTIKSKYETKTQTISDKTYGSKATYSYSNAKYYDLDSVKCGSHDATFSGTTFTINSVTGNDTCTVNLIPKKYTVNLTVGSNTFNITQEYVGPNNSNVIQFTSSSKPARVKCGTSLYSVSSIGSNTYSFKVQVKDNISCSAVFNS